MGARKEIEADTVVLSLGEAPDLQLAGMLDVPLTYDPARRGWYAASPNPQPNLYLVGGAMLGQATWVEAERQALDVFKIIAGNAEVKT